jgi:AcrR family transcriptional regulator
LTWRYAVPVIVQQASGTPRRRSRRDEILEIAVGLFAARGYHGVSMDDIGAAAGVTGPALYHHFAGKEAMLVAALIPVSERLLAGGRDHIATHADDPDAALAALVEFHVDFALDDPAVIALHLHELDRLPEDPRRQIRRLQRLYVEEWVRVLIELHDGLAPEEARVLAHAAFGLMNSTPFIGPEVTRSRRAELLAAATLAALRPAALTRPTRQQAARASVE